MKFSYGYFRLGVLLVGIGMGFLRNGVAEEVCTETELNNGYRIGAAFNILIPSHLPSFDTNISTMGLLFGVPWGKDSIKLQTMYGNNEGLKLYLADSHYQLNLSLPLISMYLLAGVHFLHYRSSGESHSFVGANSGLGFTFSTKKNFDLHMEMKLYFQQKPIVTFGGGFALIL